ncbi:hypothetical protein [Desulforamulus aquiferis]|uniref:Uncharacterized protein n=1 Tax=Desulforamulus aquiferis TaxID=1397668 RepID=A0AAW7ZHH1_9FIRM|nr:hypothetical protein [Desulforamulus aquiferis]MDO7788737.1 hypothetical protein [Desulforamulus aquiferis]RYD05575.1 hypothetical protein N752_09520 [Desulforamulus aquiferis]
MIGREYEQYLQSAATESQQSFNIGFWLLVTGVGFVIPLAAYVIKG